MSKYSALIKQQFKLGEISIVPIRFQDRYDIMKWRNEQLFHLRQNTPLTKSEQDNYFNKIISKLFDQEYPDQILFSYLQHDRCIGYGGLVHINWTDKNAEISFIIKTSLESEYFNNHWNTFLILIEQVAFYELSLHKLYTFSFDLRPKLYSVLEKSRFKREAILSEHGSFDGKYIDVVIHSKINRDIQLRSVEKDDLDLTYNWAINPEIRKYSLSRSEITYETHTEWFQQKLNDVNCCFYIAEYNQEPIGSIRFDIKKNGNAVVSYQVDPNFHNMGFGKKILQEALKKISQYKNISAVTGVVIKENKASIKIFNDLGFLIDSENIHTITYYKSIHEN